MVLYRVSFNKGQICDVFFLSCFLIFTLHDDHVSFRVAAVAEVARKMSNVRHKLLILSGKGGVGKSTFAAQLSWFLATVANKQVCLYCSKDNVKNIIDFT